jgi:ribose transport system permease protein
MTNKASNLTQNIDKAVSEAERPGSPGRSAAPDPPSESSGPGWGARVGRALGYRNIGAVYVWLLIIVFFSLISADTFLQWNTAQSVLNQNAIAGMVALSLVIPLACGLYDLSVGSTIGVIGIFAGWLFLHTGLSTVEVIVVCILASMVIGLVNSFVVVYLNINSFVGTLATGSILGAIAIALSDNSTLSKGLNGSFSNIASTEIAWGITLPVVYLLVLMAAMGYFLEQTASGRYCYSLGYNPEVARLVGVRVVRLKVLALVFSALVAGMAGLVLTASIQAADPTTGPSYLIPAFSAAFLGATQIRGGRFNPWGTVIAVLLLGTGTVGILVSGGPTWAPQIFQGVVLIAAVGLTVFQRRARTEATA